MPDNGRNDTLTPPAAAGVVGDNLSLAKLLLERERLVNVRKDAMVEFNKSGPVQAHKAEMEHLAEEVAKLDALVMRQARSAGQMELPFVDGGGEG